MRGYKVRLPLDLMLFASANPEDYTNRGRIITPLKDRFGSQIRTHYPLEVSTEMAIAQQEARSFDTDEVTVSVPEHLEEIVATISHLARQSPHVNQRSGVSVRLTVSNMETLIANAMRRSLRHGETEVVPRVSDLDALAASTMGKIEIESLDDGRDEQIAGTLVKGAVLTVFRERVDPDVFIPVLEAFEEGRVIDAGEDISSADYESLIAEVPPLRDAATKLAENESPGAMAAAVEFLLEGLHLSKRLNKDASGSRASYRSRG